MADIAKRITDMFSESDIVALLEDHRRHLVKDGVEVEASRHGPGWYVRSPIGNGRGHIRVGRTGAKSWEKRDQLRPFRCIQDAFEAALSRENREKWRAI